MSFEPYEGIAPPESDPAIALEMQQEAFANCDAEYEAALADLHQQSTVEYIQHAGETLRVSTRITTRFECFTMFRRR